MTINRHESNCPKNRHQENTCDCGVDANDPHWYLKKLDIISKMEEAFEECSHYQKLTKRAEVIFQKHLPGYSVSFDANFHLGEKISVWGNGIRFDDRISITLYPLYDERSQTIKSDWQDRFKHYLAREKKSLSDDLAQITIEDAMEGTLQKLEDQAKKLIEQAKSLAPNASSDLRDRFPMLFKSGI